RTQERHRLPAERLFEYAAVGADAHDGAERRRAANRLLERDEPCRKTDVGPADGRDAIRVDERPRGREAREAEEDAAERRRRRAFDRRGPDVRIADRLPPECFADERRLAET